MPNVLVTGATSGIGAETALALDRAGWSVFAGARVPTDADPLVKGASDRLRVVTLDVTDVDSIAAAVQSVESGLGGGGLDVVVNNAGIGVAGPLEVLPLDQLREQLETNVIGQVAVTQAFLPLVRRAKGRVLFVGSIGGRVALAFAAPYHASKFAMEAVADCLRQELAPDGVSVALIEPDAMATPIWAKAATRLEGLFDTAPAGLEHYRDRLRSFQDSLRSAGKSGGSPAKVAQTIAAALEAPVLRKRYPVGPGARAVSLLRRPLLPDAMVDVIGRTLSRR